MEAFLADVTACYEKLGRCVVAVSEGIHGPGGTRLSTLAKWTAMVTANCLALGPWGFLGR